MRLLPFIFALAAVPAWSQALPEPTGHERIRIAIGEAVRTFAVGAGYSANDPRIDKTLEHLGEKYKDAANNPQYQSSSARWAWIGFRIMQRANPWLSIALEACAYYYSCTPNPKLDIREIKPNDVIVPQSTYSHPFPITPTGFVYFDGKTVPLSVFKCGGSDSFILNAEFYFPGVGSPCRVQAGKPSAISAHEKYLEKNYDYFGIEPGDYSYGIVKTIDEINPLEISHICDSILNGFPSYGDKIDNPYWPCKTKARNYDEDYGYYLAPDQPATWDIIVFKKNGQQTRVVTDARIGDFAPYPAAPPKGEIQIQPWADTLSPTDKLPGLSPEWIREILSPWKEAGNDPHYEGLPWPFDCDWCMPLEDIEPFMDEDWWPKIDDLFDPSTDNVWLPKPRTNKKPEPLKIYRFTWDCGFSNLPSCLIQFFTPNTKSTIDDVQFSINPFDDFSIDKLVPGNPFFVYLSQRFQGSSCVPFNVSSNVNHNLITINWDFCKFANFARDVIALLAYMMTAGFLIGLIGVRYK